MGKKRERKKESYFLKNENMYTNTFSPVHRTLSKTYLGGLKKKFEPTFFFENLARQRNRSA